MATPSLVDLRLVAVGAPRSKPQPTKRSATGPSSGGVRDLHEKKTARDLEEQLRVNYKALANLVERRDAQNQRAADTATVRMATSEDEAWLAKNGVLVVRDDLAGGVAPRVLTYAELDALHQVAANAARNGTYHDTHHGTRLFYDVAGDPLWQQEPLTSAPWLAAARARLLSPRVRYLAEAGQEVILRQEGCTAQESHRDFDEPEERTVVVGIPLHPTNLSCTGTAFFVDTQDNAAWAMPALEPGQWMMWSGSSLHRGWEVRPSAEWPAAMQAQRGPRSGFLPLVVLKLSAG